ncbi:hypothetical protein RCL_jg28271.t1 [Rhizophagus clarus]|uniref:Uncharacterized protein n=1 Tax=Rhizophagus clarus TaxID=94130 RepID=A0A8H3LUA2_9GLOM|nr:hypothetical protein RCL_jg28271.t1 [Rhizophagus clarus]
MLQMAEDFAIPRSTRVIQPCVLQGRSTCEERDIKHVVRRKKTYSTTEYDFCLLEVIVGLLKDKSSRERSADIT